MENAANEPLVAWTPEMSVGVAELDEDHRIIVALINQLAAAHDRNEAALIEAVLDRLTVYVDEHFRREEEYMEASAFPGLMVHRQIHRELTEKVEQIRLDFFLGNDACVGTKTLEFLKNWLSHHILVEDMQYNPEKRH